MPRKIQVCISPDVDAVAGWLGSYGGEDSPGDISRGCFAAEVGVPRLLKLYKKYGITTTWFIPGHSLESFPKEMAMIRDAGHEIGLHGYSHENPTAMTMDQQRAILDKTFKLLTDFCGKPPKGSVAPWWETSKEGTHLLLEKGIEYDHSHMSHDCECYWLRDQDAWNKIEYEKTAESWMKPLVKGNETGLVEIPANWYLDDLPPMMFIKKAPNSHGWVNARDVEQLWKDHFTYFYREHESFVFPVTIHPDVSGRPHVLLMLERFIEWVKGHEGVEFVTMKEIADTFRASKKPIKNAKEVAREAGIKEGEPAWPSKDTVAKEPVLPANVAGTSAQPRSGVVVTGTGEKDKLPHVISVSIPFPRTQDAEMVRKVVTVDKELRPMDVLKEWEVIRNLKDDQNQKQDSGATLKITIFANTIRTMRLNANSTLEDVALVTRSIDAFEPESMQTGADQGLEHGSVGRAG